MAQEAAVSRLYGGIHFETGNEAGLAMGEIVGANVNALFDQLNVATKPVAAQTLSVSIYPNPSADLIFIKSDPALMGEEYAILDLHGKVLLSGRLNNEINTIDLGGFSPGIFLVKIGDNISNTYRIVKS